LIAGNSTVTAQAPPRGPFHKIASAGSEPSQPAQTSIQTHHIRHQACRPDTVVRTFSTSSRAAPNGAAAPASRRRPSLRASGRPVGRRGWARTQRKRGRQKTDDPTIKNPFTASAPPAGWPPFAGRPGLVRVPKTGGPRRVVPGGEARRPPSRTRLRAAALPDQAGPPVQSRPPSLQAGRSGWPQSGHMTSSKAAK
jgi:hypothetical protein